MWIGILIGLFIGVPFGAFMMAIFAAGGKAEETMLRLTAQSQSSPESGCSSREEDKTR